ncbi:MAG: alpha/beta hydrolase fold domain-containing protein, partial [Gemmataceae bacterium]
IQARPPKGERVVIPEAIAIERDINYAGTGNEAQTLDVLSPKRPNGAKPLPVIINVHGGAFASGDKTMGLEDLVPLVATGDYVGVTVNYRLSGEAVWPAQVHDCKAAVRWVRANARKYNIDPDRIGVIGASSGGHLVAMLGLTTDKSLEGTVGTHATVSSRVQAVVDQYGPTDLHALATDGAKQDHNAATSPEGRLLGKVVVTENKDMALAASPITYVSRAAPPFLIFHGSRDPIIPHVQSERLYKALKGAEVEVYFVTVTGAGHGGFKTPEVGRRTRQFFDKQFLGKAGTISEAALPNE